MLNAGGSGDTICAVATPVGEGGIGIIRISGPDTLAIASRFIRIRSGIPLCTIESHRLHLADILPVNVSVSEASFRVLAPIDEALVVYMKAPRSYTAEDVIEIHAHGSQAVLAMISESCLQAGCRLATPGEFTKRAFLNGRLDLSQAEGVLATIKATSEQSLAIAQRHLRGDLKQEVDQLRSRLLAMLAQLEAGIDFVEEDIEFVGRDELMKVLCETADVVGAALNSSRTGRVLREGARVVIVGRPNVGKSSLLNRLLGDSRAIVTNTPGTTRDLIEETVHFDGCTLSLVDTAGLRDTSDEIEREGIRRTEDAVRDADLLIIVIDANDLAQAAPIFDIPMFDGRKFVVVLNKIDLLTSGQVEGLSAYLSLPANVVSLPISTVTGEGLKTLREIITDRVGLRILEPAQSVTITNIRHQEILLRCRDYLAKALESIESGTPPECVAVDLRGAADALGEITGAITSDEVLNRIFSQFCIGK
ncbi:MAG: tRNA uridine-5-carboxymethylaminomethyl(34) synthesis GTPase MnmE [Nitrospira sp.]|jgi:tRNA modification GTPase|nr:MAG: tRNA uridine-5-carboxymethylaminomethyl(34) synthesis GTPase MnmE [Nitrospira sp. CG24D]TKB81010.1 MAG: tRNA uridine-5-carboxymethylaminomethyl(34) synthesis GTPase MnmE [Nitrospira sp.]